MIATGVREVEVAAHRVRLHENGEKERDAVWC